ncbi:MAG TPA: FAD-dependent oxidoreductase [Candidatus Saccharimonadales bacterium]|nr:FAD-dependent oxidoreductase [Candidatus Saccharimonadales bacterium]
MKKKIIVIGSGLAGMTAAVELCEAGHEVHVLESRHVIGGRTSSWNENGMQVESGLHRYLGFYSALPKLLEKVGTKLDDVLFWEDEIEIRVPDGTRAVFGMSLLHKPFETIWSAFGHNDFLSPKDKLIIGAMFAAGIKDYVTQPEKLDTITVIEYAENHHISKRAIVRLLKPITEGVFFMPIEHYSAYNFFGLFVPFLPQIAKARVGAFKGGMTDVLMQPLLRYITNHGGKLTVGTTVEKLKVRKGKVTGVFVGGNHMAADAVVLAASLHGAQKIIQASFKTGFEKLLALPTMPSVTFQIELTEPSMKLDRTTFGPTTALASFAEQSRTTFRASNGRLSVILTPPEKYLEMPPELILDVVMADAKKLGITLEGKVKRYHKVSLPHDFYSLSIGSEALRPPQETHIVGLALAGDYTKQEHLATMEGAVVSGQRAAAILLR